MVSLDHTIYFHRPRECKADEWMFAEMESPWAGDGRGLVTQRIWNREGKLLATCVQEVSLLLVLCVASCGTVQLEGTTVELLADFSMFCRGW